MRKKGKLILIIVSCIIVFIVVTNCQIIPVKRGRLPELLAHRGLAQTFDISKVKWDTNTAAIIYPPEYPYIENTIPSMEIAFQYGADIIEFDIRVTKDKELAVFHDYEVNSRTENKGNVCDYSLAELKTMDVGYGYTADNGQTFPLRGKGIGLLPSFDEVMRQFPEKKFLVHIRDDGEEIGQILLKKLERMDHEQINNISIYGNDVAIDLIRKKYPEMKALSGKLIKKAIIEYELIGWTGYIPKSMRNAELHMPIEYAKYLWGWPYIFIKRMDSVNTRMVIVTKKGQWSGGFDTVEEINTIPVNYEGCIWTERIDKIGKMYK
jgi:glycerophosphoryl diester phosphodiesterase